MQFVIFLSRAKIHDIENAYFIHKWWRHEYYHAGEVLVYFFLNCIFEVIHCWTSCIFFSKEKSRVIFRSHFCNDVFNIIMNTHSVSMKFLSIHLIRHIYLNYTENKLQ